MVSLTRDIDATLLAELSKQTGFHPVVLIESVWPDGTVRLHSGNGTLSWDSQSWVSFSRIAAMEVGAEDGDGLVPTEASMTVRGTIEKVLEYTDPDARGGLVRMWLGATTEPGGTTLIGTPYLAFTGYLDGNEADIDFPTGEAALGVTVGTGPAARENAAITHSPEDQKARHPGDTLLDRVASAHNWRTSPIQFPNPG